MLSTTGSPEYILPVPPSICVSHVSLSSPVPQSITVIPVSAHTHRSSALYQAEWQWLSERDFLATPAASHKSVFDVPTGAAMR